MSTDSKTIAPAYVSFRTFLNFLDLLRTDGVPPVIDPSMLRYMSGSSSSQLRTSLKYLGLTDDEGNTNENLEKLAYAIDEDRPTLMGEMLKSSYSFLFGDFDLSKATFRQFDDTIKNQGVSGQTVRKVESFFIQAAEYSGITISAYITKGMKARKPRSKTTKPKSNPSNNTSTKTSPKEQPKQQQQSTPSLIGDYAIVRAFINKLPVDRQWTGEQREKWFEAITAIIDFEVEIIEDEDYNDEDYYDDE